jgi:RNA polymerase sigma factor (sigma-70 family)
VLKQLDRVFNRGTALGLTEGKLLEQYVSARDEAAFAALVARHGPMVLGVCRRILRDEHDVEDAFQATFLVLVRRAAAIRRRELVGHWLHGVAHRVAVRSRAQSARRHVHEPAAAQAGANGTAAAHTSEPQPELHDILDDELARLPASLRSPVVLCYLEGLTHDEAARRLRWPVGTVRSRMARARDLLRRRLARRGVMADGAAIAAALARQPVALGLIDATTSASLGFAGAQTTAAAVASTAAIALARGVLQTMMISKLGIHLVTGLAALLAIGGAHALARQQAGDRNRAQAVTGSATEPAATSTNDVDRTDALIRSVDRIDDVLDDLDRRNHDLQKELRALRMEIAALRNGEPGAAKAANSRSSGPENAQADDRAVSRKVTIDRAVNTPTSIARRAPPPENAAGTTAGAGTAGAVPEYFDNGRFILVTSPQGDRVALYDRNNRKSKTLRLPVAAASGQVVTPVWADQIIALQIKGPKISRIAVYDIDHGRWSTHDLRELVDEAKPLVLDYMAAYKLGRYVYGFSVPRERWDVVELAQGSQAIVGIGSDHHKVTVRAGSHLYEFHDSSESWQHFDFNAILAVPPSDESKNAGTRSSP